VIGRAPLALAALALSGCSLAPPYQRPDVAIPQRFPQGPAYPAPTSATAYSYQTCLADPRLLRLVGTALAANQDIAAALANLAAARASYRIQRAALFPEVDAGAGYTRAGGDAATQPGDTFAAGASVPAWELDLFGRVRSLTAAQRARFLASAATVRSTRILVVAEVAQAWLARGRDVTLLAIAQDTAASAGQQVALTARRVSGGVAPLDEQRKAEIVLAAAQADIAAQTTAVAQDENALRQLIGAEPAAADLPGSIADADAHLCELSPGLESAVLLARPDVVEAEYSLRAANADIGAARAALFPRISLTAAAGVASAALTSLFTAGAFAWNADASASYPVFSAGRGKAGVAAANAQRDLALAQYRKAIQSAFRDVADTLARRGTIEAQLAAARAGEAAAADNARLTERRYSGGIASALDSLVARETLYSARRTAALTRAVRAANLVELYRAIGSDDPGPPPLRPAQTDAIGTDTNPPRPGTPP
jgi:multidrug efflux system outer membrane protein